MTFDVGMGCFSDILQAADRWCSGEDRCVIENTKAEMDQELGLPCPKELTSYIEIIHHCIEGKRAETLNPYTAHIKQTATNITRHFFSKVEITDMYDVSQRQHYVQCSLPDSHLLYKQTRSL